MIGVIMAGGQGTRMKIDGEKLLLKYKKPIILHVVDALKNSNCFSKVLAITSPNSPKTKKLLEDHDVEIFETHGNGYVEDLNYVLKTTNDILFITSGDLPLLDEFIIRKMVEKYQSTNMWISFLVTNKFLNELCLNSEYSIIYNDKKCNFTGISLVDSKKINSLEQITEKYFILDDRRIAFNLNTQSDYDLLRTA